MRWPIMFMSRACVTCDEGQGCTFAGVLLPKKILPVNRNWWKGAAASIRLWLIVSTGSRRHDTNVYSINWLLVDVT